MFANLFGGAYKFDVGDVVHLGTQTQLYTIRCRGYLLVGAPGRRIRVPVYGLETQLWMESELHWDCYYEDQLYAIGPIPF
jgi:hypothetical protein